MVYRDMVKQSRDNASVQFSQEQRPVVHITKHMTFNKLNSAQVVWSSSRNTIQIQGIASDF